MSADAVDADEERSAAETGASDWEGSAADGGQWKRVGTAAAGAALVAFGLKRRSLGGAAIALVGGWLSARAVRGLVRPDRDPSADASQNDPESADEPLTIAESITIAKPPDELSELLRDADALSRIAGPVAEVESSSEDRQRWTVEGPLDRRFSWETEVTGEEEELRWEPIDGAALFEELAVDFREAPGDRGTIATLRLELDPPGGEVGKSVTERLDAAPESVGGTALDRFKSFAETGEIPTTEANPSARGRGDLV